MFLVQGTLTEWSDWMPCTATLCDLATATPNTKVRNRECKSETETFSEVVCDGPPKETSMSYPSVNQFVKK